MHRLVAVIWTTRQNKEHVGLRLDRAMIDHFRAGGPGWQSRINAVPAEHEKAAGR